MLLPFDEKSVENIIDMKFDFIKVTVVVLGPY